MTPETKNLIKLICAIASVAVLLIAALILAGTFSGSRITELPSNTYNPVDSGTNGQTTTPNQTQVKLYFRYLDTNMLATETRTVQSYSNQRLELAVLRELLSGPGHTGLSRVIDSQARVVGVQSEGDTLIVTLSEEFLRQSSTRPDGWGEDAALRQEDYLRMRLAVFSVVNTLTGMGEYSHVQILIDFNNTGVGEKVSRTQVGFVEESGKLQPMAFDESVSLTAANTVRTVMGGLIAHDWQKVYLFLSAKTETGLNRPLYDTVAENLQKNVSKLFAYEVAGETLSADGKRSVVFVDLNFELPNGTRINKSSVPIRLRAVNEIWMIDHDRLFGLFSEG